MSSYQYSLESGVLWCSQDLDLSLLPLVFSLILTVASRLLHLYSTIDKTSRLMMKSFSTVRDIWRGTQSYMEKRRGRREIEVTWRRRGGIKRAESKLASNHFPVCSSDLRLLAGSVSLLLIPPFILLATTVSFLPLLFSV